MIAGWINTTEMSGIFSRVEGEAVSCRSGNPCDLTESKTTANIAAFAAEEADIRITGADCDKEFKYRRQANRNRTISKLAILLQSIEEY